MIDEKRLVKAIRHSAYIFADKKLKVVRNESIDPQNQVERCLSCPFKECFNCFENKKRLAKELWVMRQKGESVAEICNKTKLCRRTVYYLIKEITTA